MKQSIGYESGVRHIETGKVGTVTMASAWLDVVSILWNDGTEEDAISVVKLEKI